MDNQPLGNSEQKLFLRLRKQKYGQKHCQGLFQQKLYPQHHTVKVVADEKKIVWRGVCSTDGWNIQQAIQIITEILEAQISPTVKSSI